MIHAAGIDAAPDGWAMAVIGPGPESPSELLVAAELVELLDIARERQVAAVGIDIPIGLAVDGSRAADTLARARMGRRHSTVFTAPAHAVLTANTYVDAKNINHRDASRGISKQAYSLMVRIRQARSAIRPTDHPWIVEVHPECSFAALNEGTPLDSKHDPKGRRQRILLIETNIATDASRVIMHGPAPVIDGLDAYAAAWSAARLAAGKADVLGHGTDPDGYPLTITV